MVESYSPQGSAAVLINAARFGLYEPLGTVDKGIRALANAILENEIPTKNPDLLSPYQNVKTQRYYEHHFDVIEQPLPIQEPLRLRGGIGGGGVGNLPEWVCELARFPVPYGSFGILKSIEQYLWNGEETITQSANWGIPWKDADTGPVRWYLRLDHFDGYQPPRYNQIDSSYLPGFPYPELATIDYIWFPAGSPTVWTHSMIPGGFMLRFFVYAPQGINGQIRVAGRLRGFVQSNYSTESAFVARAGW